jgi:hypothetical protein
VHSSIIEKIQSLAVELIDRDTEVVRAVASGPWPALIYQDVLWTPRRILDGRVTSGTVTGEVVRKIARSPRQTEREIDELANAYVQRSIRSVLGDVRAVEYGHRVEKTLCGGPSGPFDRTFLILTDQNAESGIVDTLGLSVFTENRVLQVITPTPELRRRWSELESDLGRYHEAVQAEIRAKRANQLNRNRIASSQVSNRLRSTSLPCPNCRRESQAYRYLASGPESLSFFVCPNCGRSFLAEDVLAS